MPENIQSRIFRIGDFSFRVLSPEALNCPENFLLFKSSDDTYSYTYEISICDVLPSPEYKPVTTRDDIRILKKDNHEERLLIARGDDTPYAIYREISDDRAIIRIKRNKQELFSLDTVFNSVFALERHLIDYDALLLHCAYIEINDTAVLFSAPSGVGKSTQASLWEQYKKANIINGDRALIQRSDQGFMVHGFPVCGSSEICHARSLPIKAIVMLSQAKSNHLSHISLIASFTSLYGQITINSWDRGFTEKSVDILNCLAEKVPIYKLDCTISQEAVDILYSELFLRG